ncbi:cytochrome c [Thiocapsa sp.]|uniref:c-type cytochrome n=1 Tax=Thiocapsa sp. TaxID=2024551 RepID=UPI0025D15B6E|nr:cytochrome c [Thiocapsa sp.]
MHDNASDSTTLTKALRRGLRRLRWLLSLLILIGVAVWLSARFTADRPVDYADIQDQFKYGSIGSEPGGSVFDAVGGLLPPEPIFAVLPHVCPDKLPGGYAALGLLAEEGRPFPIGISQRHRLGVDQVGLNCAVCHTGTVRATADGPRRIVLGMPSHQLDLQGFFRFVLDCTLDERFTADNLMGLMARNGAELDWFDRVLYRFFVIPRTREQTLILAKRLERIMGHEVPDWGPGRVDTFNPYKGLQFNWPLARLPSSELIAASDFPSLWNQQPRDGMYLHWDGNNDSVDERNLSASLGAGVTPVTIDHPRLQRVRDWIWTLPPPAYPYPIDQAKAARGEPLYAEYCGDCHADHRFKEGVRSGTSIGTVVPIADIGTDRHRLDSYTFDFAANQYSLYPDSEYRFTHFRKTQGYANHPLDGIWARAPYLHNGSVPTLRALLDDPKDRPARFYRGFDVFDQVGVGFIADVPEENGRRYFLYDTALPGNGNDGHRYAIDLPSDDKDAIVEYLKTF